MGSIFGTYASVRRAVESLIGDGRLATLDGTGKVPADQLPVGSGSGLDTEAVQDVVGAMIVGAGGTYDDGAGTITLPAGGGTGADGDDGREVELQTSATHVQWRYVGDVAWTDLIALSAITGPAGADGEDGAAGADGADGEDLTHATPQTINPQTGTTYTLQASDAGKLVTLTNEAAITLTIPGSVFTAGQRVDCLVAGTGMVTAVESSCTVTGTPSLVSRAQWSAFSVLFTSATTAVVIGDLA